jgi:hypothetical protein
MLYFEMSLDILSGYCNKSKWLNVAEPITLVPKRKVGVLCGTEDPVHVQEAMKNRNMGT